MRKIFLTFSFCLGLSFASDFQNDLASGKIPMVESLGGDIKGMREPVLPYDEVVKLYKNGEYEKAGDMFLALMLQGDYRGAAYIAEIYEKGLAGVQDCEKAKVMLLYAVSKNYCIGYEKILNWIKNDICIKFDNEDVRKLRILEFEGKVEKCVK